MIEQDRSERRALYLMIAGFILLAAGSFAFIYVSTQNYKRHILADLEKQLAAIVKLKVGELERWRKDRLEHGTIISNVEALSSLVRRSFVDGSDPEARRQLYGWFVNYSDSFHYDQIRLLDVDGNTLISLPAERPVVSEAVQRRIAEVVRSKQVTMVDFYRNDHDKRIYLTMLIPVRSDLDAEKVIGVVAMRVDPDKYVYPLINSWPTTSVTAETLLVRREGDEALFLNELKFRKDSALNLRVSLGNNVDLPAAKAILGSEGFTEGIDYRGAAVAAYLHAVPDSPWYLVARIDSEEVYEPLKERVWWMTGVATLLLLSVGAGLGMVRRQRRVQFYRTQYRVERERAWLLSVIARSLNEIYVFDPDTLRFTFVNEGGVVNLGYSMDELQQLTAFYINPEFTEESFRVAIKPLLTGEQERLVFDTIHRRKNSTTYPVEVYLQLIDTADSTVFLAVVNDITSRKQTEKELQDKNTELERFAYTVSHDLKSPIITIKGFTGALEKDLLKGNYGRMAGDLKRVSDAADKMDALLRDLLELSTIGHVINAVEMVDMNLLADFVLEQLAGSMKVNNLNIEVQKGLPQVLCDRLRMAEVLQNLMENAIRYIGDQSDPKILFGMREENGVNVFFVQDNGIGIDEKFHQLIFGLFNKLDAKSDGTGVGLALVKRIIDAHGGRVWVESEGVGKGSRFCFTLPG